MPLSHTILFFRRAQCGLPACQPPAFGAHREGGGGIGALALAGYVHSKVVYVVPRQHVQCLPVGAALALAY